MTDSQRKFDTAIWRVVSSIASGRVMGYGEVARAAGYPRHARMVSKAMGRSAEPLPWYRVVRSDRRLAFDAGSDAYNRQRRLLENEGVLFVDDKVVPVDAGDARDLDELFWGPE